MTKAASTTATDTLFARPLDDVAGFCFDDKVAAVFEDMIKRSVPGYATVVGISGVLASHFAQPDSHIYDLGCALGATALAMADSVSAPGCTVMAVDNSASMIQRLRERIETSTIATPIQLVEDDILTTPIDNASLVALNYTLQFVALEQRDELLRRIFNGMRKGGVLVLSEKIHFEDPAIARLCTELHHEFKRRQGYSDLEISQKRSAIENVLIPETIDTHERRLRGAGFSRVEVWFQCFNFASLVAFK
ncbi:MAG: carboxy-S-adenosyl-L-methionine synthase [marine bacterium B5-7]|nr:MAG: carboxy-S-adenosyl-L-methionine synthase [marine bacterium B5-7]